MALDQIAENVVMLTACDRLAGHAFVARIEGQRIPEEHFGASNETTRARAQLNYLHGKV